MSKRIPYQAYPFVHIRLPAESLSQLNSIPGNINSVFKLLKSEWNQNLFLRSAIKSASPGLANSIDRLDDQYCSAKHNGLLLTFLRYFVRMSYRPTPFGLFAGVATEEISFSQDFSIRPDKIEQIKIRTRPDMGFTDKFVQGLLENKKIREQLSWVVHQSLYLAGGEYRYIISKASAGGKRFFELASVEMNNAIDFVANTGSQPRSFLILKEQIIKLGYAPDESGAFIHALIDAGILVSNLQPVLTRYEYADWLDLSLKNIAHPKIKEFRAFNNRSGSIDSIESILQLSSPHQYQFDTYRQIQNIQLPEKLINQVLFGLRIIHSLTLFDNKDSLSDFRKAFERRFGDQVVPLNLALDQDQGVAIDGPPGQQNADPCDLLDDLADYSDRGKQVENVHESDSFTLNERNSDLPDFYELSKEDIKRFSQHNDFWPEQFFALISLSGPVDDIEISFNMASEGHAVSLMNRFGFHHDSRLPDFLQELLEDEIKFAEDKILAEVIHLPEGHAGNVLQRKTGCLYEIPITGQSTAPHECTISLKEISVKIDNEQVILVHQKSKKQIIPIINNAHNYRNGQIPVYEFLLLCGRQKGNRSLNCNRITRQKRGKVPGVRYQNMILRPTRYYFDNPLLLHKPDTPADYLKGWAKSQGLPQQVSFIFGDRNLFIDWTNASLTEAFIDYCKSMKSWVFEPFRYSQGSPVQNKEGAFANEIVLSYKRADR